MTLPPYVSRLLARLAFLASLLFAVGTGPTSVLTTLLVAGSDAGSMDDRDEEDVDDDVDLHRQSAREIEHAERDAHHREVVEPATIVQKAVPFAPKQRVPWAPQRPPYRPLLRMLC